MEAALFGQANEGSWLAAHFPNNFFDSGVGFGFLDVSLLPPSGGLCPVLSAAAPQYQVVVRSTGKTGCDFRAQKKDFGRGYF